MRVYFRAEHNLGLDGGANGVPLPLLELVFRRPGSVGEELEVMGSVWESRKLHAGDSKHTEAGREALTASLHRSLNSLPSPSAVPPPSSSPAFIIPFRAASFPSVLYMPFTCVSVAAGVSECTCVFLCQTHSRVVVRPVCQLSGSCVHLLNYDSQEGINRWINCLCIA